MVHLRWVWSVAEIALGWIQLRSLRAWSTDASLVVTTAVVLGLVVGLLDHAKTTLAMSAIHPVDCIYNGLHFTMMRKYARKHTTPVAPEAACSMYLPRSLSLTGRLNLTDFGLANLEAGCCRASPFLQQQHIFSRALLPDPLLLACEPPWEVSTKCLYLVAWNFSL